METNLIPVMEHPIHIISTHVWRLIIWLSQWISAFPLGVSARESNRLEVACVFTSRECVSVSVYVCLPVRAITFEAFITETPFLLWCYILTIFRSSLSVKVIA